MVKRMYIQPDIVEGQALLRLWEPITNKPMTSREIEFAREVKAFTARQCIEIILNASNCDEIISFQELANAIKEKFGV